VAWITWNGKGGFRFIIALVDLLTMCPCSGEVGISYGGFEGGAQPMCLIEREASVGYDETADLEFSR